MSDIADLGFNVKTDGIKRGIDALGKLQRAEDKAGKQAKTSGGLIERSMRNARGQIDKAQLSAKGLGTGLGSLKGLIAGVGIVSLGRNAINMAANFSDAMNVVEAKATVADTSMLDLRNQAKKLGSETRFSATEAAEGMGFLAQAGLDTDKIYKAMPATLNLATAAGLDLATAADIATNVMGQFGLSVDDLPSIMDTLAHTSAKSNTSVEEMAEAFNNFGPLAKGFGISVEDSAIAVGLLANNGFKSGRAGTVMKNMLGNLASPAGKTVEALKGLNLTTEDFFQSIDGAEPSFIGIEQMLTLLQKEGTETADVMDVFGRIAGPGLASLLTTGADGVVRLKNEFENVDGVSKRMADTMNQGLGGALKNMSSAWEGFNLALMDDNGGSAGVQIIVEGITEALRWMSVDGMTYFDIFIKGIDAGWQRVKPLFIAGLELINQFLNNFKSGISELDGELNFTELDKGSETMQRFADGLKKVGEWLSPLIPYLDEFAIALIALKGVGVIVGVLQSIGGVIGLINPVTLAIAGIATAVYLIYDNWGAVVSWWTNLWGGIKSAPQSFVNWWNSEVSLTDLVLNVVDSSVGFAQETVSTFFDWWDNSPLKEKTPKIVTDAIGVAREYALSFFTWWSTFSLADKVALVKSKGIELVREGMGRITKWWATPLEEKTAIIADKYITGAKLSLDFFYDKWNGSELKERTPTFIVNSIANAKVKANKFFTDWNSTTIAEKGLKIKTAVLETAKELTSKFKQKWDAFDLKELLLNVKTKALDGAQSVADSLFDKWNNSELKELSPQVVIDSVNKAYEAITNAVEYWKNTELKEISFDAGYETVNLVTTAVDGVVDAWKRFTESDGTSDAKGLIGNFVDGLKAGIKEFAPSLDIDMKTLGLNMLKALGNGLLDLGLWLVKSTASLGLTITKWGVGLLARLGESIRTYDYSNIGALIGAGLATLTTKIIAKGVDFAKGLGQGITDGAKGISLIEFAASIFIKIRDLLAGVGVRVFSVIVGFVNGFAKTFNKEFESLDLKQGLKDAWANVVTYLEGLPATMKTLAGDAIGGFATGLKEGGKTKLSAAAQEIANILPDWLKKILKIASPSKVLFQFGSWASEGLALGIRDNIGLVANESKAVSETVVTEFNNIKDGLEEQLIALGVTGGALEDYTDEQGRVAESSKLVVDAIFDQNGKLIDGKTAFTEAEAAARILQLTNKDLTEDMANFILQGEGLVKVVDDQKKAADEAAKSFGTMNQNLDLQILGLTEGEAALNLHKLELQNLTDAQIAVIIEKQNTVKVLGEEKTAAEATERAQAAIVDRFVDQVANAGSAREALKGLSDDLSGWLKDKVKQFAATSIKAVLGLDTSGAENGLLGFVNGAKSLLGNLFGGGGGGGGLGSSLASLFSGGGGAGGGGGFLSSLTSGISGLFGGGGASTGAGIASSAGGFLSSTGGVSALGGASSAATAATAALGGTTSALGALAAAAGPIAVAVGSAAVGVKYFLDETNTSTSNFLKGFLATGNLVGGGIVGSLLGGKWETTATGSNIGFENGGVVGNDFEDRKKKKSLWRGSKRETITTDLDEGLAKELNEWFSGLNTTIVDAASTLGAVGADSILANFEVATTRIDSKNAEEELTAFLEDATLKAYTEAFYGLGPEVKDIISSQVDIIDGSVEDIQAAFAGVSEFASVFVPALESVGLAFESVDSTIGFADKLATALGGTEIALERLALYADEFIPDSAKQEAAAKALQDYRMQFGNFTIDLLQSGQKHFPATREAMHQYIESLQAQHDAGKLTTEQFTSMTAAALENLDAVIAIEDATIRQTANFNAVKDAADVLNLTFDQTSPLAKDAADNIVALMGGIDGFNAASSNYYNTFFTEEERKNQQLLAAAAQVRNFNNELGLVGDAAIDTREEFRNYVEGLDLTTEAGQKQFASAMELVDAMGLVVDSEKSVSEIIGALPENLQTSFEQMTADTAAHTEELQAANDARVASNLAANEQFAEHNKQAIELLQTYADGLDTSTEAGQAAYDSTIAQIGALESLEGLRGSETDSINTAIDALQTYKEGIDLNTEAGRFAADATQQQIESLEGLKESTWVANEAFNNQAAAVNAATLAAEEHAKQQADLSYWEKDVNAERLQSWYDSVNGITDANDAVVSDAATAAQTSKDIAIGATKEAVTQAELLRDGVTEKLVEAQLTATEITTALRDGVTDKFTETQNNTLGIIDTLSAGVISKLDDTSREASMSANDAAIAWANSAANISGSSSSTTGSLNTAASAITNIGKAANIAANDAANASQKFLQTTNTAQSKWDNWLVNANGLQVDGSHALGLPRVPFDGYIAELHQDEAVLNKLQAKQYRESDKKSNMAGNVYVSNSTSNNDNGSDLKAIRKELEMQRKENETHSNKMEKRMSSVVYSSQNQVSTLKESNRIIERNSRRAG